MNVRTPVAFAVVLLAASSALAADDAPSARLSDKGHLVIGAERLFGMTATSLKSEAETAGGTQTSTTSHTNFSLLWSYPTTVHNIPRLGLDYLVTSNFSLGLGAGFFTSSSKRKAEVGNLSVKDDGPTITTWLLAPRAGYVLDLGDTVALWLRGGFTFYGTSTSQETTTGATTTTRKTTQSGTALNLEPSLVITPVPHFGFYGGLALDFPLSGTEKQETTTGNRTDSAEMKYKQSSYGAVFGLLGWF